MPTTQNLIEFKKFKAKITQNNKRKDDRKTMQINSNPKILKIRKISGKHQTATIRHLETGENQTTAKTYTENSKADNNQKFQKIKTKEKNNKTKLFI